MRRRDFIALVGGAAAALPLVARAQQPSRVRRIGILMPYPKGESENEARVRAFKQELAKLGWTDGGNIAFDEHWTADNMDMVRSQAAALVASNRCGANVRTRSERSGHAESVGSGLI